MIKINFIRFGNLLGITFINKMLCVLYTHLDKSYFEIISAIIMYLTVILSTLYMNIHYFNASSMELLPLKKIIQTFSIIARLRKLELIITVNYTKNREFFKYFINNYASLIQCTGDHIFW